MFKNVIFRILMDIDGSGTEIAELKKGQKIIVDGQEVGEINTDMSRYTMPNDQQTKCLFGGNHSGCKLQILGSREAQPRRTKKQLKRGSKNCVLQSKG